jgi:16S rRNA (cytosine967-C5)-methyltransferase
MTNLSLWGETPLWPSLLPLWRELMSSEQLPLVDRWLKNSFKHPSNSVTLPQQLLLSRALMDGIAFAQLACALEHSYQQQTLDVDWAEWDNTWHFDSVKTLPPTHFWGWMALRCGADFHSLRLKDAPARQIFFNRFSAAVTAETSNPFTLLWHGVRPQWLPLLMERVASSNWSDQQLQHFIKQQTRMPPLWLRPHADQAAEQLVADLVGEGVKAALSPDGHIYASGGKGITTTQVYQQGWVEIQDLASQQIAEAVAVKPGQKVWDSCAGAGGKSLAIAARMANKGVLVATDLYDYKLDELKRRAKRAEMFNIRTFTWNGAEPLRLPKEVAQQQGFDWVLVDAPCSSSGTWRRNPDARWRFDPTDTKELVAIQQQILIQAAPAVRLGGHLVYATCSWQLAENEVQISWFLRQCPQFLLQYQRILGTPQQDADTMFVAVLQRQS